MRWGDIGLHFHLLCDPGTNHCSTLGLSFSFSKMGHCGLLGGLPMALVTREQREGNKSRPSPETPLGPLGLPGRGGQQKLGGRPLGLSPCWALWAGQLCTGLGPCGVPTTLRVQSGKPAHGTPISTKKCSRKDSLSSVHSAVTMLPTS